MTPPASAPATPPDAAVAELIAEIHAQFPAQPAPARSLCLAYACGDAWSVENLIEILDYRPWPEITDADLHHCGAAELRSYLRPEALLYYLPALLISALRQPTRLSELLPEMLLPAGPGHEALWPHFSDWIGFDGGALDAEARSLLDRAQWVRERLTPAQRRCVGRFIALSTAPAPGTASPEALALTRDFIRSWTDEA